LCSPKAEAQAPTGSILRIEVENHTLYVFDCANSQLASNPNQLTRGQPKTFESSINIGDIVSVNGTPVKGTVFESISAFAASPNAMPGQAIADTTHNGMYVWNLELLNLDGTPIGAIQISGLAGGQHPPGYPKEIQRNGAYIVTGGTGAFFGVRGYWQADIDAVVPVRNTSACEDPAFRRANGGGKVHGVLYLVPIEQSQITAVFHSDFSSVTAAKPAKSGEVLIVQATGLGPTRPGVDPGQPFPPYPANPLQVVNSPVDVTVNGQSVGTINAIGWPRLVDTYRVDFQVPAGTPTGTAAVQLSAAWIVGPSVNIPIQ
jgi:uncharacterized protein (TIGR03437 family)